MKNSQLNHLRLVLACIVVLAVHGFFLIEQPRQTHLFNYFRWQWFQERICYVPCLHIVFKVLLISSCMTFGLIYYMKRDMLGIFRFLVDDGVWAPYAKETTGTFKLVSSVRAGYRKHCACSTERTYTICNYKPWP